MPKTKNIEAFYTHKFDKTPTLPPVGAGDFNVFRLSDSNGDRSQAPYARYDFYKIMLIRGKHRCHYADKSIAIDGSTLLFFNPAVPYQFERLDKKATGFFCLFKDFFFTESHRNGMHDLPIPPKLNTDLGGKGLHDDAPPVNEFLDSVFEQLKKGRTELTYALSAEQTGANNAIIQDHFKKLNGITE